MKKKTPIQVLWPAGEKTSKGIEWRILLLGLMFSVGTMMSIVTTWSVFESFKTQIHAMATIGVVSGIIYDLLKRKYKAAWIVIALPWPFLLAYTGLTAWLTGVQGWLNQLIITINEVHSGKLNVFSVNATEKDAQAFILILALFIGQETWHIIRENRIMSATIGCLLWIVLMTLGGNFHPVAATLLICSFYGLFLASRSVRLMRRNMVWLVIMAAAFIIPSINNGKVQAALEAHDNLITWTHDVRYGKTTLPMGDMSKAGNLHKDNGDMLTVSTDQVKTLYLRDFTGGIYRDGKWSDLPYTAYTGENAGMFKWLEREDFDALTQVSAYYSLCDDKDDVPEKNTVAVDISGACSWYGYISSGLDSINKGKFKENGDRGFESRGLLGESSYEYTEMSSEKPSELTIVKDWVSDPKTPEQQKYSSAEAVYREYVYNNYTDVDEEMAPLVSNLFWDGYTTKNDSVYNAVERVRKVLADNNSYRAGMDSSYSDTEDPLYHFLEDKGVGNDMYFASAGVLALRLHGIPARYAEGYYVSSTALQAAQSMNYTVDAANAHSWVEVYFDGIGWLPVDVTPGYYMSAADMQQMFTTPEDIHKTAAFDDQISQSDTTGSDDENGKAKDKDSDSTAADIMVIMLGILAIVIIVISILIFAAEIIRVAVLWWDRLSIEKAGQDIRVKKLGDKIYRLLSIYGIDAGLSWNTKETDQVISEKFCDIDPGEYTNICKIIEQQVYGGIEIAKYQERTLNVFIMKLFDAGKKQNLAIRVKLHYFI